MRAVNLFTITRGVDSDLLSPFERSLSQREEKLRIKRQELDQMRDIVHCFEECNAGEECYADWFYSFTIPHISREFDLLKVGGNEVVVNVELKSESPNVTQLRMKRQLERNAYYLSLIGRKIYSFTYVGNGDGRGQLYMLQGGNLKKCSFEDLIRRLKMVKRPVRQDIEEMFKPGDYLISPFSEPERFVENQYFLTEHQQMMKAKILTGIRRSRALLWGITGEAGTGKTLLLYDIAKALSEGYAVGVVHCGRLSEGHGRLRELLQHVDIIESGKATRDCIREYDIICVDETQRMQEGELKGILEAYQTGQIKACIFVYDFKQVLSKSERDQNTPAILRGLSGFSELRLAKTIRTSKEIYAFINAMLELTKRANTEFPNIDVLYAADAGETRRLLEIYAGEGYRYISLTDTLGSGGSQGRGDFSHDVIGLEFEKVLVVLDERFSYDDHGRLVGEENPDEDYLYVQMLYQSVSRAKERLCVVVQGNREVFRELMGVLYHSKFPFSS